MPKRTGSAHVVTTTRKYKGKVYRTHLLRRSYREGKAVRNETLGNLSHLPDPLIDVIRRSLQGEQFVSVAERFEIITSHAHGHVQAVKAALDRLGLASLLGSKASRERSLVLAMVAARILAPQTKLATTRWWHTTTLAGEFGVAGADEAGLYAAMDWLLKRQPAIEKKLAGRHLEADSLVLYVLSSSYFEGSTCPLAKRGYSRDGRKGKLQVNYGLLTDARGCPVAVSVYEGNTADAQTLMPEIDRLRTSFGVKRLVMVGDRGMISHKAIGQLREQEGVGWVTALKSASIRTLLRQGHLQLDLFDERNLFEMTHPDYPGERLVACRNPGLAKLRAHKRESIAAEAALDGLYIIRTCVSADQMDSAECVRRYKSLAQVERAFRSLKTVDLKVRPIHHRLADRVRAHIFLCMLAYYVEWHMREAWRELIFADEDQQAKMSRDPVAPATRSAAAERKALTRTLEDGTPTHSFTTLLAELGAIVRNTCRMPNDEQAQTFQITTTANPKQSRALELVRQMPV